MILRFTTFTEHVAFNTDNGCYTTSADICSNHDKFLPHEYELADKDDIYNLIRELKEDGYTETNEAVVFYNGETECTEFITDDLPFC